SGEVVSASGRHIAVAAPGRSVVFGYWHVDPVVSPYLYVTRGGLLGYVHPGAGHVHLSERRSGRYVNPLRRGGLAPYADHTKPVVDRLEIYRSGTADALSPD